MQIRLPLTHFIEEVTTIKPKLEIDHQKLLTSKFNPDMTYGLAVEKLS